MELAIFVEAYTVAALCVLLNNNYDRVLVYNLFNVSYWYMYVPFNTMMLEQNDHFSEDIFKITFLIENM